MLLLVAGLAFPSTQLEPSQVRPLNLEELSERAGRIFLGQVLESRASVDRGMGRPVTVVTFKVDRSMKGNPGESVTAMFLATDERDARGGRGIPGFPPFRRGEQVLMFLYADGPLGLTSPVGFGQGKFSIYTEKEGRRVALNASGNRHLFQGLGRSAAERLGPLAERWRGRRELDLEALIEMVRRLQAPARADGGQSGVKRDGGPP